MPDHCFKRDTRRSLGHLLQSSWMTAACVAAGRLLIPFTRAALPLWIAYAAVTGTVAMGLWVLAHECGHGAFSDNRRLQDTVGFILHSALLVPYFSWQRSHAVHHQHTNHIYKGETHVPTVVGGVAGESTPGGEVQMDLAKRMGKRWLAKAHTVHTLSHGLSRSHAFRALMDLAIACGTGGMASTKPSGTSPSVPDSDRTLQPWAPCDPHPRQPCALCMCLLTTHACAYAHDPCMCMIHAWQAGLHTSSPA